MGMYAEMNFLSIDDRDRPRRFVPTMATQGYPGASLSLSQLAFALNEKLKRASYPSLYVLAYNPRPDDASMFYQTVH